MLLPCESTTIAEPEWAEMVRFSNKSGFRGLFELDQPGGGRGNRPDSLGHGKAAGGIAKIPAAIPDLTRTARYALLDSHC